MNILRVGMAVSSSDRRNTLQVMRYAPIVQQEAPSVGTWCRWADANAVYSELVCSYKEISQEYEKVLKLLREVADADNEDGGRGNYDSLCVAISSIHDYLKEPHVESSSSG